MTDAESASVVEDETPLRPAEAFAVVGNETRLAILEALWEADERPVSFSTLRERVGMRDSAQFNYHLKKLTGQFVRKTDEGYDFSGAGRAVIQAVLAGSMTSDPVLEPFPVTGDCVDCGGEMEAWYADEALHVACAECDRRHASGDFPPGGLEDRTSEEIVAAFNQRTRHILCLTADGVCPACNGRTESAVSRDGSHPTVPERRFTVEHECLRCGYEITTPIGVSLLDHVEVVSFHRDHGVDLTDVPFWTLPWCITDRTLVVLEEDPLVFRVRIELGAERLDVTIDADLEVLTVERSECAGSSERSERSVR